MFNYFSKFILILSLFTLTLLAACSGTNSQTGKSDIATKSLKTIADIPNESPDLKTGEEMAVFAGGCFWGIEGVYEHIKGVRYAGSGYTGGKKETANYDHVSAGKTDHAEAVKIIYDPKKVTYEQLLEVFFTVAHNPTQLNYQGPDVGKHYRSAIFYVDEKQKELTEAYINKLTKAETFSKPIVTQVVPLKEFYTAEDYHQDYMFKNPYQPYIVTHDKPKVAKLSKEFPNLIEN